MKITIVSQVERGGSQRARGQIYQRKNNPDEWLRRVLDVWQDHLPVEAADGKELVHEAQCPAKPAHAGNAGQDMVLRDGERTPFSTLAAKDRCGSSVKPMLLTKEIFWWQTKGERRHAPTALHAYVKIIFIGVSRMKIGGKKVTCPISRCRCSARRSRCR